MDVEKCHQGIVTRRIGLIRPVGLLDGLHHLPFRQQSFCCGQVALGARGDLRAPPGGRRLGAVLHLGRAPTDHRIAPRTLHGTEAPREGLRRELLQPSRVSGPALPNQVPEVVAKLPYQLPPSVRPRRAGWKRYANRWGLLHEALEGNEGLLAFDAIRRKGLASGERRAFGQQSLRVDIRFPSSSRSISEKNSILPSSPRSTTRGVPAADSLAARILAHAAASSSRLSTKNDSTSERSNVATPSAP